MSMQGSEMMYVIATESNRSPRLADQLFDELRRPFGERGAGDDTVESGLSGTPQPLRVRVVREPEDRRRREGLGDLVGVDARDVDDHEIGRVDALGRDETVVGPQENVELTAEEEVDPSHQDRRHGQERTIVLVSSKALSDAG